MTTVTPTKPDDWNSTTYSRTVAPFVPALTTRVTSLLSPSPTDTILDLGCGDGVLTKDLAAHVTKIVGIDSSANMIAGAKEKYAAENVDYFVWDGADVSGFLASDVGKSVEKYDKVFSNAAIHWIMAGPASRRGKGFKGIYDALKSGGVFVSESGGHLNCADIRAGLFAALLARGITMKQIQEVNPWWFPTKKEMQAELVKAGFETELIEYEYRPTELTKEEDGGAAGWVRLFCASFLRLVEDEARREEIVRDVAEVMKAVGGHTDEVDGSKCGYVRIRVVARKPATFADA